MANDGFDDIVASSGGFGRRGGRGGGGERRGPPNQTIIGTVVGFEDVSEDRKAGPDLFRNKVVVALEHPVPDWGIQQVERDETGRSQTLIAVSLPRRASGGDFGMDVFRARWGDPKNANNAPCPPGSMIMFENCYFKKPGDQVRFKMENGSNYFTRPASARGEAVAKFMTVAGRPKDLHGDAEQQLPPTRNVFPNVLATVSEIGSRTLPDGTVKHFQQVMTFHPEAGEFPASPGEGGILAAAQSALYGPEIHDWRAKMSGAVVVLARRDLSGMDPEEARRVAAEPHSSLVFTGVAKRPLSRVRDGGDGCFYVSCTDEGLARAVEASGGAVAEPVTLDQVVQAAEGASWLKEQLEKEAAIEPIVFARVRATPDQINAMIDAAPMDLAVHTGPVVAVEEGRRLGASYYEGVRAALARGLPKPPADMDRILAERGYAVTVFGARQMDMIASHIRGNPKPGESKDKVVYSTRDESQQYRIYEACAPDNREGLVAPDGRWVAPVAIGVSAAHVITSEFGSGMNMVRDAARGSRESPLRKLNEIITPGTDPIYAEVFDARLPQRVADAKAFYEAREAAKATQQAAAPAAAEEAAPAAGPGIR